MNNKFITISAKQHPKYLYTEFIDCMNLPNGCLIVNYNEHIDDGVMYRTMSFIPDLNFNEEKQTFELINKFQGGCGINCPAMIRCPYINNNLGGCGFTPSYTTCTTKDSTKSNNEWEDRDNKYRDFYVDYNNPLSNF